MVEIIRLPNNATLLLEQIDFFQSAAVGFFVEAGSRFETPAQAGISHFIEHMLFKGTETRTGAEIARAFDRIGGQVNAYTAKEMTCFYAKTLHTHLPEAIELLTDMLLHPRMDEKDIDTERGVILEEINMVEDSPDDLVVERLFEAVWGRPGLGSPILGDEATVSAFAAEDLRQYMAANYLGGNLIVSVAGKFDRDATVAQLTDLLAELPKTERRQAAEVPAYRPTLVTKEKDIEQNHLCYGFPAYGVTDPKATALSVVSAILGEGMSSRLFQHLREQLGLVYSVTSFQSAHRGCGLFSIYTAQQAENEGRAREAVEKELELLRREGITEEELFRARESIKTGLVMGFENSSSRMSFNARDYLRRGRVREAEELLAAVDAVDVEAARRVIAEVFDPARQALSVVGRIR